MEPGITFGRLLVFPPGRAVDAPLVAAALRALRRSFPVAEIVLMAATGTEESVRALPFADRVLSRDGRDEAAYIRMIEDLACDGAIFFTSPGRSPYPDAYRCYLAGIPFRLGESSEFGGAVLSHWVKGAPGTLGAGRYLSLVESLGIPLTDHQAGPGAYPAATGRQASEEKDP